MNISELKREADKELNVVRGFLSCSECGSKNLEVSTGFDGRVDGLPYDLSICCKDCGIVSPLARLNNERYETIVIKDDVNSWDGGKNG